MTKRTGLYDLHVLDHCGKMVECNDWMMPLHYGSPIKEHMIVRNACGIFDLTHMGTIDIEGVDATEFLRKILANDVGSLKIKQSLYSCILNEAGKILDDVMVYQLSSVHYRLVVNVQNTAKDMAWFLKHNESDNVSITLREDLAMISIQGPKAVEVISSAVASLKHIRDLKPLYSIEIDEGLLSRSGTTGEDGFEWILPEKQLVQVWCKLMGVGAKPIGLAARDSLRIEAGYNVYGQDMDESVSPLDVGLGWTVAFNPVGRQFIGRAALELQQKKGAYADFLGVMLSGVGMFEHGMELVGEDGSLAFVTSAAFSPVLNQSIGFARFSRWEHQRYAVIMRKQLYPIEVVKQPFVKYGQLCFSKLSPLPVKT